MPVNNKIRRGGWGGTRIAPLSTIRLFGRSSRKREAEQTIAEHVIVSEYDNDLRRGGFSW